MCCPLCGESRYRLYFNEFSGLWVCHNCGESGGLASAKKFARDEKQTIWKKPSYSAVKTERRNEIPEFVEIEKAPFGARRYVFSRISQETAREYGVLFAPSGAYWNRIILPVWAPDGALLYFQARALSKRAEPKYMNPRKVDVKRGKGDLIFNLDGARASGSCVIVEGWFDAVSIGGVATFGKGVTEKQAEILANEGFDRYTVLLDFDALRESIRLCGELIRRGCRDVRVAVLEEGDANSNLEGARLAVENAMKVSKYDVWRVRAGT